MNRTQMEDARELIALLAAWQEEESRTVLGWDFSYLDGRMVSEALPWEYPVLARSCLRPTDALLDMGTGGGELLRTLGHPPENTTVTESYPPNAALCRERLEVLGVTVVECGEYELPFPEESFDVVLNRHASYDLAAVDRVLKPGGWFVTQQVGGQNNRDLSEKLLGDYQPRWGDHCLNKCLAETRTLGWTVERAEECFSAARFYDVGAVVWFARMVEWEFPGFSVERCFDRLLALRRELSETGWIAATEHRFLMMARKPKR